MSIWLPQFPMDRWRRTQERLGNAPCDDLPLVLAAEGPHGPVVHAANRPARQAGVTTGARVVDMRALCPALQVDYADLGGDRAALDRLALWARRWCPWTAADGAQGLVLDTTGTDHLWGGEAAMLDDIEGRLGILGLSARVALAPTWGAAWALARFGPPRAICTDPLPVAALRLDPDTVLLLNRLGLRTIGALAAVPRLALARRFARADLAANPLLRLDQMTGHLPEPLAPPDAPPVFRADARLAEPIFDPTHHLPGLCADLCAQLAARGQGARRLALTVYRTDGTASRIEAAAAAASREPAHLAFLFRERIERIDPGFGFDLISLEAPVSEAMAVAQGNLAGGTDAALELAQLVDRLTVRFGAGALSPVAPTSPPAPLARDRGAERPRRAPLSVAKGDRFAPSAPPSALASPAVGRTMPDKAPPSPPGGEGWGEGA
ncbi:MAG: Y-family DNA polymerase, partial [Gemmobacter sp.]